MPPGPSSSTSSSPSRPAIWRRSRPNPTVTAPGRVQVDQRGPRAAVAHPLHQLAEVGPAPGRPGVPGVAEIMEPELRRQPRLLDSLAPHRLEVGPPQRRPLGPTNTRPAAPFSENSRRCSRSTGTTGSGMATVRLLASVFGGPSAMRPLSSLSDRSTRTVPARRFTSARVSAISSPQRRLLATASSTRACHRSWRPTTSRPKSNDSKPSAPTGGTTSTSAASTSGSSETPGATSSVYSSPSSPSCSPPDHPGRNGRQRPFRSGVRTSWCQVMGDTLPRPRPRRLASDRMARRRRRCPRPAPRGDAPRQYVRAFGDIRAHLPASRAVDMRRSRHAARRA